MTNQGHGPFDVPVRGVRGTEVNVCASYTSATVNTFETTRHPSSNEARSGDPEDSEAPTEQEPGTAELRMGFLMQQYPAQAHRYLLDEVVGLRARGLRIETASIERAARPAAEMPSHEAAETRRTHYLGNGRKARTLRNLVAVCMGRPDVLLRGLFAVLSMKGLGAGERLAWLRHLAAAMLIGRWLKLRRLNHLHVQSGGEVASLALVAAKAWRVPYSVTVHGPEELLNVGSHHLGVKVAHASFVFCSSDHALSQLAACLPAAQWPKLSVIRLGVDPLVLTPPSRPPSFSMRGDALRLVCTGRMVPADGHLVLLEAIKLLREREVELQVTLIGEGPELHRLEDFVALHQLADRVLFTGALSHASLLAQLRRADLFAMTSFSEGVPMALMEAMSLGLPSVSTTIAGIPELLRGGVDGLLVPPANASALAAALESMVNDPVLRRSLGASARQRIINQYNLPLNQELLALTFRLNTATLLR